MNHKQKLGYVALGALIMLVGLAVGAIVSPPLIAQRNDVFDKITCRSLEVVDENGNIAVRLESSLFSYDDQGNIDMGAGLLVYDSLENVAIGVVSQESANRVYVNGKAGDESIKLMCTKGLGATMSIFDL